MKTLDLGFSFQFTPAIQNALRAVDEHVLPRTVGGFGPGIRCDVPLKPAERLVGLGLVEVLSVKQKPRSAVEPTTRLAARSWKATIALTKYGLQALQALKANDLKLPKRGARHV